MAPSDHFAKSVWMLASIAIMVPALSWRRACWSH